MTIQKIRLALTHQQTTTHAMNATATTFSHSEILTILRDCREAAEAARSIGDLAAENKYMDQMAPYLMELESRKVINKIHKDA